MRLLEPDRNDSIAPMDERRERRLRGQLLLTNAGFAAVWALVIVTLVWGSSRGWVVGAAAVAMVAYPWLILVCIRNGIRVVLHNSIVLVPLASAAVLPASIACLSARAVVVESLPNNAQAIRYFERTFGQPPDHAVSRVYSARDRSRDRGIFVESEAPYFLQFSVSSPEDARSRLGRAGFATPCPQEHPYSNTYHPADFPVLWLPFAVSSALEKWCAQDGAAWLDSESHAVYMILSMGWSPPR